MSIAGNRVKSELPAGDPALMNRLAWARRWSDRQTSVVYASNALKTATDGQGRRSRSEQGYSLRTLAWQARWRGEFKDGMDYALKAETFLSESAHPETRAGIYATLGVLYCCANRMDLAMSAVERGFWLLDDMPEDEVSGALTDLLTTRASIQRHLGERARAGIALSKAREIAGNEERARVDQNTARWLLADRDHERALEHALMAIETADTYENRVIKPYALQVAASCYAKLGNESKAKKLFEEGYSYAEEDKDQRVFCRLAQAEADFEAARGNTEVARDLLVKCAAAAKKQNFPLLQKEIALALADVFEKLGEYKTSVDHHKLAWRLQKEARNG